MSGREGDNWMVLVEDRVQWRTLILAALNLLVIIVQIHYINYLNGYSKINLRIIELCHKFNAENSRILSSLLYTKTFWKPPRSFIPELTSFQQE
jgi:hypothetical protein